MSFYISTSEGKKTKKRIMGTRRQTTWLPSAGPLSFSDGKRRACVNLAVGENMKLHVQVTNPKEHTLG